MSISITPDEVTAAIKVLEAAVPLGEEIIAGIKALFGIKYGALTIDDIQTQWQANLDEATKNSQPPV